MCDLAGVQFLHLSRVWLNFPRWARAALPALTHLHLSDTQPIDTAQYLVVDVVALPKLTHLASTNTRADASNLNSAAPGVRPYRHYLGLHAVAHQLTLVAVQGPQSWLADEFWNRAPDMGSLQTLVVKDCGDEQGCASLRAMLCGLPRSLRVLELHLDGVTTSESVAADAHQVVAHAFLRATHSLSGLDVLNLGGVQAPGAGAAAKQIERLAQVATACGVRVKWV